VLGGAFIIHHKMDSEEELSIDSDELHDRRTTDKRPAAKKPAARRRKARPLPDSVKKQFLNDVEAIGSYHQIGQGKRYCWQNRV
jgi:hypothetical protein